MFYPSAKYLFQSNLSLIGINRDLHSLTHQDESDVMDSEDDLLQSANHSGQIQTLPGGSVSKFHRQMSEQPRGTSSRKTRTYPPKESASQSQAPSQSSPSPPADAKPKPPQRTKIQVATLEVHNVKKAINRYASLHL